MNTFEIFWAMVSIQVSSCILLFEKVEDQRFDFEINAFAISAKECAMVIVVFLSSIST